MSDFRLLTQIGTSVTTNQEVFKIRAENLVHKDVSGYKAKIPVLVKQPSNFGFGEKFRSELRKGKGGRAPVGGGATAFADSLDGAEFGSLGDFGGTVVIEKTIEDQTPCECWYDPENPEADEDGYVTGSNVSTSREVLAMTDAESGVVTDIEVEKALLRMMDQNIDLGKGR